MLDSQKPERDTLALMATVLGCMALVIQLGVRENLIKGVVNVSEESVSALGRQLGTLIGSILILPSIITGAIGTIISLISYFTMSRGVALASAITYIVAIVLMPTWGFLVIPAMIIQFVVASRIKAARKALQRRELY